LLFQLPKRCNAGEPNAIARCRLRRWAGTDGSVQRGKRGAIV